MVSDEAPVASPTRSSLLYAMGRLQALNEAQSQEIKALPDRVFDRVNPRLVAVEKLVGTFEDRLRGLERWRWVLVGGGGAILTVITLGSGLVPVIGHFRL